MVSVAGSVIVLRGRAIQLPEHTQLEKNETLVLSGRRRRLATSFAGPVLALRQGKTKSRSVCSMLPLCRVSALQVILHARWRGCNPLHTNHTMMRKITAHGR